MLHTTKFIHNPLQDTAHNQNRCLFLNKIRITLFFTLFLFLQFGCTTHEVDNNAELENTDSNNENPQLLSNLEFRVENYNVDTLTNCEVGDDFFDKHIKGNDAFRINNNNPLVNSTIIRYYLLDTLVNSDIKVITILESAASKVVGSRIIALILNENDTFRSSTLLALTEENTAWKYYWRSYIKNDTLYRLSTGMGDPDTTQTLLRLNGFKNIELIDTKP